MRFGCSVTPAAVGASGLEMEEAAERHRTEICVRSEGKAMNLAVVRKWSWASSLVLEIPPVFTLLPARPF